MAKMLVVDSFVRLLLNLNREGRGLMPSNTRHMCQYVWSNVDLICEEGREVMGLNVDVTRVEMLVNGHNQYQRALAQIPMSGLRFSHLGTMVPPGGRSAQRLRNGNLMDGLEGLLEWCCVIIPDHVLGGSNLVWYREWTDRYVVRECG